MKAKLIKKDEHYFLEVQPYTLSTLQKHTIIANTFDKPKGHILQLSLKNCQAIERGYDLDELAYNCSIEWHGEKFDSSIEIYKEAFQKALELMGDKKFTEEDVRKAMDLNRKSLWTQDESIQSLQQTEWDVEVIMECPQCQEWGYTSECRSECNKKFIQPKLDADGWLILKRVS